MATKDEIAAELIRRGVSPDEIAAAGYPQVATQGRSGYIGPPNSAPDAVAQRQVYTDANKRVSEQRDKLSRFYPSMTMLENFQRLNAGTPTGMSRNQWPFEGITNFISPNTREMSGIASQLQGQARPPGSGATSDFEQRLYRMGVPGPEKRQETNDSIVAYQKGVLREEDERLAFMESYLAKNGHLGGANEAWTKFVMANPYTTNDRSGQSVENTKRQPWKVHFGVDPAPKRERQRGNLGGALKAKQGGVRDQVSLPARHDGGVKGQTVLVDGKSVTVRPR